MFSVFVSIFDRFSGVIMMNSETRGRLIANRPLWTSNYLEIKSDPTLFNCYNVGYIGETDNNISLLLGHLRLGGYGL